ncbi:MAG TPA: cyclic 2,3-diphosphoglycerate synthase [Candidatus Margulisiibacteriota bacterium]|nr:cyclic 2,3-diphosphoglycerate synthase [Candidatus Margulisiibacteriota bacterium]
MPARPSSTPERVLILGAAGRDFHVFNTYFRECSAYEVVGFTAAQIPGIAGRRYPAALAGARYPQGVPIHAEDELEQLIADQRIDQVIFAYSDIAHVNVMHLASRALAAGADFRLLGPEHTFLEAACPVISVCAVRTGCGKGEVAERLVAHLRGRGVHAVVIRHPMPYGDLEQQALQRFATLADCERYACTIEEREEYEHHLAHGAVVYAGVDYARIVRAAEAEADVIIWDGGNNDLPFIRPGLEIVVVDPHRAGHELAYHPGEANFRRAHVLVVNKVDSAPAAGIRRVLDNAASINPRAVVVQARSEIRVDNPELIRGRRVLVIEDGPTLTHGEMAYGAGVVAAQLYGAAAVVDPRPYAVGSLRDCFARNPWISKALPAEGYSPHQIGELQETIRAVPCDTVIVATPVNLDRLMTIAQPRVRVTYSLVEVTEPTLSQLVDRFLEHRQ